MRILLDSIGQRLARFHRAQTGAVALLCLASILILFMLGLVVFDTIEVANEKTHVQISADASAYAQATVNARTMNMVAYSNVLKRLNVGLVTSWVTTFNWMTWLTTVIAVVTAIVCIICAIPGGQAACTPCEKLIELSIAVACVTGKEWQDRSTLKGSIMSDAIGPEVRALNNYQEYFAELTPFWGWSASAMRGLLNAAPIAVSWPPPNADLTTNPARLPLDHYDKPLSGNLLNPSPNHNFDGMCDRAWDQPDNELLYVDFLLKSGIEAASNGSTNAGDASGSGTTAPDGQPTGSDGNDGADGPADSMSSDECNQVKDEIKDQFDQNDDMDYDETCPGSCFMGMGDGCPCGQDGQDACSCPEDERVVSYEIGGNTWTIDPNDGCRPKSDAFEGECPQEKWGIMAVFIAGTGAHFNNIELPGFLDRILGWAFPDTWKDNCKSEVRSSFFGSFADEASPMDLMMGASDQEWWYASSNLVVTYRPNARRNNDSRMKYEFIQGSFETMLPASAGTWAMSRAEIAYQNGDPNPWETAWAARMRPVALPGEWPYGSGDDAVNLKQAFLDSKTLLIKQFAVAEGLEMAGWDLITHPYLSDTESFTRDLIDEIFSTGLLVRGMDEDNTGGLAK